MTESRRLLAVETSSKVGRLALADAGRVVAEREITAGMRHGRELLPAIDEALRACGWSPRELALLAVSIGPGSFTGLRIAVMFARTLAWQTRVRVVAVPTLRVIAENAPAEEQEVAIVCDAQRGGVYWAVYHRGDGGTLTAANDEAVGPPDEVAARLSPRAFLIGSGLARYGDLFGDRRRAAEPLWWPRAAVVAELGWAMHLDGRHTAAELLEPRYVRRPAPEEVWERRQRGGR